MSPLKDNQGTVRYFIGARVDVTALVEDGKTMESFYQLLASDRPITPAADILESRPRLRALRDFGNLLNDEEKGSMRGREIIRIDSRPSTPTSRHSQSFAQRRFVGIEERISQNGLHSRYLGQVPGVYQNVSPDYLYKHKSLTSQVRPRPSLSFATHNLHFSITACPWSLSVQARGPHWRPRAHPRFAHGSTRPRHWRHSQSLLVDSSRHTL